MYHLLSILCVLGTTNLVIGQNQHFRGISRLQFAFANHSETRNKHGNWDADLNFRSVCYYSNTASEAGGLQPEDIDPFLCTHILFAFGVIHNNTLGPQDATHVQIYKRITKLKLLKPSLKVLFSVGSDFPPMVASKENRTLFITQAIPFLLAHNFDGLDVDWEFPAWGTDKPQDKELFTEFLKDFSRACALLHQRDLRALNSLMIKDLGEDLSAVLREKLLLTLAVAAPGPIINASYEVDKMSKYVDFVSIMCYDYHWFTVVSPLTGHNSPLLPIPGDQSLWADLNIVYSANLWHKLGMPKEKINIGVPTYGHTYKLFNANEHGLKARAIDKGLYEGWITFPQVCEFMDNNGTFAFDDQSMVPYGYRDLDWISFDDAMSLTYKVLWSKLHGFGGIMTWNLNSDDWEGKCHGRVKFPLHKAIGRAINFTSPTMVANFPVL